MDSSEETEPLRVMAAQNNPTEKTIDSMQNAHTYSQETQLQPEGTETRKELENRATAKATSKQTHDSPHDKQEHTTMTDLKENLPENDDPQQPSRSSETEESCVSSQLPDKGLDDKQSKLRNRISGTENNVEEFICVKFYAALRKEADNQYNKMYLVIYPNERKIKMTPIRSDSAGCLFRFDLNLCKADANLLYYTYCLNDKQENLQEFIFRKLFRNISETDKVFHQFDDVCVQTGLLYGKKSVINKIRSKFIQSMFTQLIECTNEDLTALQTTALFLLNCVQIRRCIDPKNFEKEILTSWRKTLMKKSDKAFRRAIEVTKDNAPVQYVLAATFLVQFFNINLGKDTIEKLSKIVKQNGVLQNTLAGVEETVQLELSEAVRYSYRLASEKSSEAALWLMVLFYAVSPEYVKQLPYKHIMQKKSAVRNLPEVVKTHFMLIQRKKDFKQTVLDMSTTGDGCHLLKLGITPDELLSLLIGWQSSFTFYEMHEDVLKIKDWLKERI